MKLIILLGLMLGVLNAESRYALLIGNSEYKHINNLKDPSKDIKRLKQSLEDLDFVVSVKKNLTSEYLAEAIEEFSKRLSQDKNNIGFLYYSGHGCQLNYQGYLVPTDVDTKNKVKIKHHALSINEMLETLSMANNRVNMLFLDACRDVPSGSRGGTKGLGQLTATPKGALVVYATEAGKTADDNSNFINALIDNIKKPNQNVKDMADNISNAVADKTGEKQIPVVFYKRLPTVILLDNSNLIEKVSSDSSIIENIDSQYKKKCPQKFNNNIKSSCYTLRVGDNIYFSHKFYNNHAYNIKFRKSKITFSPENGYKYNNGNNPRFTWSNFLYKSKGILKSKKKALILKPNKIYEIKFRPKERNFNNIVISYNITYNKSNDKKEENIKVYKHIEHFEISWCGDGIVDWEYGEKCDTNDKTRKGWGNLGCTTTCLDISKK